MSTSDEEAVERHAVVITCSTRAARGVYADRAGPLIVAAARSWGLRVAEPVVVPDGPEVDTAMRRAIDAGVHLLVTTGGTGISPTDRTPDQTMRLIDRQIRGIAEAIRAAGVAAGVPTAMLSRGIAGVAGRTLVINLPGSVGGVRDGLAVLEAVVPHALDQIAGGDH